MCGDQFNRLGEPSALLAVLAGRVRLRIYCLLVLATLIPAGCKDVKNTSREPEGQSRRPSSASDSMLRFESVELPVLETCRFSSGQEAQLNTILEIVGGGVGCIDYDLDGVSDLFFPGGGTIDASRQQVAGADSKLLRGDLPWQLSDTTAAARLDTRQIYSHGVTSADFDQDGFPDLLVYGYRGILLFHNQGDGTFQEVAGQTDLAQERWTTAAAWVDLDRDGSLDLYLGSYLDWNLEKHQVCPTPAGVADVCSPNAFGGASNIAYLNSSDGTFRFASSLPELPARAKTLGILAAELSAGHGTSVYVANDLVPNFLLGLRNGNYEEHGYTSGVAVDNSGIANGSMGVALLDFNLDRRFDLFVTNFEHEQMALYLNEGDDLFQHASRKAKLNLRGVSAVGFGVVAGDFDGDADEDVVLTAGHVQYHPDSGSMKQLPILLENNGARTFVKLSPECRFFKEPAVGRGLAAADLDNDGDLDLVASRLFGAPALLENVSPTDSNWLRVALVGVSSPRTPIGATAELVSGEHKIVRQLYGGGSYLSQSQQDLHFSWPGSAGATLSVRWPDGSTTEPVPVAARRRIVVIQGR